MGVAAQQPEAEDGSLPQARTRLTRAVSALIDDRVQIVNDAPAEIPSLIAQLDDASPGSQGTGHMPARSIAPVWIDASTLLGDIDATVRKWQPATPSSFIGPLRPGWCRLTVTEPASVTRLRFIRDCRRWRPMDCELMDSLSARIEAWTIDVETLLTPQPNWHLPNPCPACNVAIVYRKDTGGETIRKPALSIGPAGCECLSCRHVWGPQLFQHLANVLGYPLPAGILE